MRWMSYTDQVRLLELLRLQPCHSFNLPHVSQFHQLQRWCRIISRSDDRDIAQSLDPFRAFSMGTGMKVCRSGFPRRDRWGILSRITGSAPAPRDPKLLSGQCQTQRSKGLGGTNLDSGGPFAQIRKAWWLCSLPLSRLHLVCDHDVLLFPVAVHDDHSPIRRRPQRSATGFQDIFGHMGALSTNWSPCIPCIKR